MKNLSYLKHFVIILIACLVFTCKDQPTSESVLGTSYHTSACIGVGLEKSMSTAATDSIFSYDFSPTNLDVYFSVIASCGRPENGFIVNHRINCDTIDISVIDTNRNVARCLCKYMVSVLDMPIVQDRYLVRCTYYRSIDSISYICHFVEVKRSCGGDTTDPGKKIYNQMLFDREGGGNLIFTLTPTLTIDTLLFEVTRKEFRDTSIQGVIWGNRTTMGIFDTLFEALNGKYQIMGNYAPDSLPAGTWTYVYMVDSSGRTEVTNVPLRNTLLKFERIVLSKLNSR